jgi:hypothetical protein
MRQIILAGLLGLLLVCSLMPVEGKVVYYDNSVEVGKQACVIAEAENVVVVGPDGYVSPSIILSNNYKIILINIIKPGIYRVFLDNEVVEITGWIKEITIRVMMSRFVVPNAKVQIYKEGQLIYTDWTDDNGSVKVRLMSGSYTAVVNDSVSKKFDTSVDEVVINVASPSGILTSIPWPVVGSTTVVVIFLICLFFVLTRTVG